MASSIDSFLLPTSSLPPPPRWGSLHVLPSPMCGSVSTRSYCTRSKSLKYSARLSAARRGVRRPLVLVARRVV
jgi:hypothetical protein